MVIGLVMLIGAALGAAVLQVRHEHRVQRHRAKAETLARLRALTDRDRRAA